MNNCYQQFSIDEVFHIQLQMLKLEKCERDMLVLDKLQVMAKSTDSVSHARKVTAAKCQRVIHSYCHVCKTAFCFIHNTGEKILKNLQKHLQNYDVIPSFGTTRNMVDFIKLSFLAFHNQLLNEVELKLPLCISLQIKATILSTANMLNHVKQ